MDDNLQPEKETKVIVEPSIMSGFIELLPREQMLFNDMKDTIRRIYESFGFIPLDTPVLEKSEVLLAKSGGDTAKQVYRFQKGDSDISMRFDLTVPLARYVASHSGELTFPFRRYHIGKVYRGEKPQRGRFREFYQCDIDIVGNGTLDIINDSEIVSVIYTTFRTLNIGKFMICMNNRKLLSGFFNSVGIKDHTEVLRVIDKIDKIGKDNTCKELQDIGVDEPTADNIIQFISVSGPSCDVLKYLYSLDIQDELFRQGLSEMATVCEAVSSFGVPDDCFKIDLKIARGLDYYTGSVYETFLTDNMSLGSICSGGRYDELASNYSKNRFPGVGISIGLSRLFYKLNESGLIKKDDTGSTPTQILFIPMNGTLSYVLSLATQFRSNGINSEVYMNQGKIGKKFAYADKLGIPYVAVVGEDEMRSSCITVKDMKTGVQTSVKDAYEFKKMAALPKN